MKTLILAILSLSCALGLLIKATAQSTQKAEQEVRDTTQAGQKTGVSAAAQATSVGEQTAAQPALATPLPSSHPPADQTSSASPPAQESARSKPAVTLLPPLGPNELRLNFRNAPIESVLNYLSDAAGFIIVPQTGGMLTGKVSVWSNQPVTKDEALNLLGSALDQNGYAFVLVGRTLTIYTKSDAKTKNIPVKSSNRPEDIPRNDQIVTQIIPVKFINAVQLSRDLQPLKSDSASWSANESANSLIVTDTQVNVHRLAEIIKALDTAISSVSSIKVFKLQSADAKAVASVIKELFAPQDIARSTGATANAARFQQQIRGGGRGGAGALGGGGQGAGDESSGGGRAPTPRVIVASEDRSNSLVVSAPLDRMPVIEEMIKQLDTTVEDVTEFKVFRLRFADAQETADLLTSLFSDSSFGNSAQSSRGGQIQFSGRFGGAFGGGFVGGNPGGSSTGTDQSARFQKQTRVVAVPDLRTGSVIVSAARDLLKQIEGMVADLDSDPAKKQQVFVYDLQNSDPTQVQTILQTLFPNQVSGAANSRMNPNQAGAGNQLNNRATQNQNNLNRNTGFGSGRNGGSGGFSSGQ